MFVLYSIPIKRKYLFFHTASEGFVPLARRAIFRNTLRYMPELLSQRKAGFICWLL